MNRWFKGLSALMLASASIHAQVIKTEVKGTPDHYQLLRDGKPYFIKGAGGDASMELLKQMGGNSVRLWGVDNDITPLLDKAQQLGITVTVGIWLGQERSGFSYNNADDVAKQYERVRSTIEKYKSHPAVLMWGIGNEMEGYAKGDNAAIWSAIENLAVLAHKLDPNHPTMTVTAEIGGERVKDIHRLCPDIDIEGINSYGGASSIPKRYEDAGGTKPYVVTEFGPLGQWESGKTKYDAPLEMTSTQKADFMKKSYEGGVLGGGADCFGSYCFLWGQKNEATFTWYGMVLPDGTKMATVSMMNSLWTGKPAIHEAPSIEPIKLSAETGKPGDTITASVHASGSGTLKYDWQLHREQTERHEGGDPEKDTQQHPEAIIKNDGPQITIKLPNDAAAYRLYCIVRDGENWGASANIPLLVSGDASATPSAAPAAAAAAPAPSSAKADVKLPLVLYGTGASKDFAPSGWMGNAESLAVDPSSHDLPHQGTTCMKITYKAADNFAAVAWQNPPNNWGDQPGGKNLSGAKKLSFWARAEKPGTRVAFKLGIYASDKKFSDTASAEQTETLGTAWKQYSIDLAGKDLTRVMTPFVFAIEGSGKPATFYLSEIRYE